MMPNLLLMIIRINYKLIMKLITHMEVCKIKKLN